MEGELWKVLYRMVMDLAKVWPHRTRRPGCQYSDAWIVLVYLWAVLHDRPQGWACQRRHWPERLLEGRPLPSASRLSERLRQASLRLFLAAVLEQAKEQLPDDLVKCIDAKPLPVGSWSKDRDARWGRAGKGQAKGYKLYAVCTGVRVDSWRIGPMNEPEPEVARALIPEAGVYGPGYLLGDAIYDSNALYDVAANHDLQLVAPRKKPGTGLGHRRHSGARLRSIELLEGSGAFGRSLFACRVSIEQRFAQAGNLACGLSPLPNWVRRPHRVALWVACKLLILSGWNAQKQRLAA